MRLTAKNEGVNYHDACGTYRFNVSLSDRTWNLYLPGSYGDSFQPHVLSQEDRERILPRIVKFLSVIRWFGLFPSTYSVNIIESESV